MTQSIAQRSEIMLIYFESASTFKIELVSCLIINSPVNLFKKAKKVSLKDQLIY